MLKRKIVAYVLTFAMMFTQMFALGTTSFAAGAGTPSEYAKIIATTGSKITVEIYDANTAHVEYTKFFTSGSTSAAAADYEKITYNGVKADSAALEIVNNTTGYYVYRLRVTFPIEMTGSTVPSGEIEIAKDCLANASGSKTNEKIKFMNSQISIGIEAPVITTISQTIDADSIAIEGKALVGSTVKIYNTYGGEPIGTGVSADGTFSIVVPLIQNSSNMIFATATYGDFTSGQSNTITIIENSTIPDTTAPVITINGDNPLTVAQGSTYTDAGATATDVVDGAVAVTTSGTVDTNTLGTYTITYTAKDKANNTSTATRTVNVTDQTAPSIAPVLTAVPSYTSVVLNWTAATDNVGVVGYDVLRGTTVIETVTGLSYTDTGLTEDTIYNYVVRAKDAAENYIDSNVATVTTLKHDTEAPAAPIITTPAQTINAGSITVTGTAETGSTITITGGTVPATGVATGGTFSIEVTLTQDVVNTLTATATDGEGNTSEASSAVAITEDSTAPAVPSITAEPTTSTNGDVTVTITYASDATVREYKIGDGTWTSYTAPFTVSGNVTVYARCQDAAGNYSDIAELAITNIDNTEPDAPIITTLPAAVNADSITITGTAEPGSTVTVYGGAATATGTATSEGTFSIDVALTPNEVNTLFATAADAAGNTSEGSNTVAITEDSIAPTATITYSTTAPTNGSVTATLVPTETVTVTNNGGSLTYTFDGNGSFTFEFKDAAGNTGSATATVNNIDKTEPAAPVITTSEQTIDADTITVTGTAEAGSTVTLYNNGAAAGTGIATDGAFSIVVTLTQNAINTLTATATDAAGNTSAPSAEVDITEDSDGPIIGGVADGGVYSGDVTPTSSDTGLTVVLTKDGVVVPGYLLGTPITEEGLYVLTVTDGAGHSTIVTWRIDKTAPTNPAINFTAPTGYVSDTWTNQDVTFKITPGTDLGSGVDRTEYKLNDSSAWTLYTTDALITISDEGITNVTARTVDNAGLEGTAAAIVKIDKTAPWGETAPVLKVTKATRSSVSLSWTAATDNVGIVGYDVLRNGTKVGSTTSLVYTDTGLSSNTTYKYIVRAKDAAGNYIGSNEVSAKTSRTSNGSTTITPPPAALEELPTIEIFEKPFSTDVAIVTAIDQAVSGTTTPSTTITNAILGLMGELNQVTSETENEYGNTFKKILIEENETTGSTSNESMIPKIIIDAARTNNVERIEVVSPVAAIEIPVKSIATGADVIFSTVLVDKATLTASQRTVLGDRVVYQLKVYTSVDGVRTEVTNFTGCVKVTIPYTLAEGEQEHQITAYKLITQGTLQNMVGTYDSENENVVFKTREFSIYIAKKNVVSFKDLAGYEWAREEIESLASKGVVHGVTPTTFVPGANITRAEFTKMLVTMLKLEDNNAMPTFKDVKPDQWFYHYVAAAQKAGLVEGESPEVFAPNAKITRQDMTVIIMRALGKCKTLSLGKYTDITFTDKAKISDYARNSVATAVKYKLVEGSNNIFRPLDNATRAEAAMVVGRVYRLILE